MRRLALAAVVLLAPSLAVAADAEGSFAVDGIGTWTCQRFIDERKAQSNYYFMFGGWLDGYLTAINAYSPDTYDLTPWESAKLLMALMDAHCRERPDQAFVGMVVEFARTLKNTRLATPSPVIDAVVGERSVKVYQATMMQVQAALRDAGFYGGTVDGQFGPQTQSAIEAFQGAKQIEVTGLPDQMTLLALLRPGKDQAAE